MGRWSDRAVATGTIEISNKRKFRPDFSVCTRENWAAAFILLTFSVIHLFNAKLMTMSTRAVPVDSVSDGKQFLEIDWIAMRLHFITHFDS